MTGKTKDTSPSLNKPTRIGRKEEEKPLTITKTNPLKRFRRKDDGEEKRTFWVQIRLFPIWLRIIIVLLLMAGAGAAGLIVGYGYIGDGEPMDALKWETWKHILNIIQGKES